MLQTCKLTEYSAEKKKLTAGDKTELFAPHVNCKLANALGMFNTLICQTITNPILKGSLTIWLKHTKHWHYIITAQE